MTARERKFLNSIPSRGSGVGEGWKQGVPSYPPEAEMKRRVPRNASWPGDSCRPSSIIWH